MEEPRRPSFITGRRWLFSLHFLLTLAGLLAVLGMVNYLAARHFVRLDWSAGSQTRLSPITERVLAGLTNDVRVIIYYDREAEPFLYQAVAGLLREYRLRSPRIRVETVDFVSDPPRAEMVKATYKLTGATEKNLVIFDCNGNWRFVEKKLLSDLDVSGLISGQTKEVRRTHFRGEMEFTSAILSVSNPRSLKAYFLRGHGEHQPDDDNAVAGYSEFAGVLRENNVKFDVLSLAGASDIPADCNLLIIAGPTSPLAADELEKIERYLRQGGRAFILFHYGALPRAVGLERVLAKWGVQVGNNVVRESRANSVAGQDVVVRRFGVHAITKPFYKSMLQMVLPRSISSAAATRAGEVAQIEPLALASDEARVISDIRPGPVPRESPTDPIGSVPLIVAVEQGSLPGVTAERGSTRLVVAGDSAFLGNEMIAGLANRDFAAHVVNWLLARNELLGTLGPRPIREYKLLMTAGQLQTVRWILLAGLPGAVLLLGALVTFRRRK